MKQIIIKDENCEKIEKILSEVQGKARTRTVSYEQIKHMAEREIDTVVHTYHATKKSMNGLSVRYMPDADNFPRAYKYRPQATWFTIRYGKDAVPYLVACGRDDADRVASYREVTEMPQALTDAIAEAYKKGRF